MSKNRRQLITLGCIVVIGGAFLWYFEYGPRVRPIATTQATAASGRGFTIAVPKGFELALDDDRLKAVRDSGGVALAGTWRAGAGEGMRPSIAVIPLPSPWSGGDLAKDATCADVANQAVGSTPGLELLSHKVATAAWGPTCEWEVVDKARAHGALGTFIAQGTDGWVITCNASPQDQRARTACHEVVASWKFSPPH